MFHSQFQQDELLEQFIFKGFKNGFFIDVGAHDGVSLNNTLYFEKQNNWNGINIEPIPSVFKKLTDNRKNCTNLNCAISLQNGTADFLLNTGYTEMLSGLKENYDSRHLNRLTHENEQYSAHTEIVKVPTRTLESICDEHDIKRIHYLSIDVEGAEFDVIRSINFDKIFIDVIEFESNYPDTSIPIVKYLEEKHYVLLSTQCIDIFMIHTDSIFYKNLTSQ